MKTLELTKATAPLAEYAREVDSSPVILTENGRPVAALISLQNVDAETMKLSQNDQFIALMEHSRGQYQAKGGISPEEMRRRLSEN
jgi:prevent-host-death family protein